MTGLNDRPVDGNGACVLYWMQRSQRATDNPALECAVRLANDLGKPVLVYFGLYDAYPMASLRAFRFMLEGLQETAEALEERGIGFLLRREHPRDGLPRAAREFKACAVVVDEDYLRDGRAWREHAASALDVKMLQVDAETIVPARLSGKEEWSAYTLRRKIQRVLGGYFVESPGLRVRRRWTAVLDEPLDARCIEPGALAESLETDRAVGPVSGMRGGAREAGERLRRFLRDGLPRYAAEHNRIGEPVSSGLSPWLHFGQVSALRVGLEAAATDAPDESIEAFLEQLIVRRELAINYCLYNPVYDSMDAAPAWARKTLEEHAADERPVLYELEDLETASTHDELWNASQRELVKCGTIHNYMRMVWAKCILLWSPTPAEALARCLYLNDRYALDGRDPNGYLNIAWCIFGKTDRAFGERPVFGKVRCMTTAAAKRKFDWRAYIRRVEGCR